MPRSKNKRDRLAQVFGQDALGPCRAVWSGTGPAWVREIEAVALLRQILAQTYIIRTDARGREMIKKRDADDAIPPGHIRLAFPYDPDARWSAKGDDLFWLGLQGPPHRDLRHHPRSRSRDTAVAADHGHSHHRGDRSGRQGHRARGSRGGAHRGGRRARRSCTTSLPHRDMPCRTGRLARTDIECCWIAAAPKAATHLDTQASVTTQQPCRVHTCLRSPHRATGTPTATKHAAVYRPAW